MVFGTIHADAHQVLPVQFVMRLLIIVQVHLVSLVYVKIRLVATDALVPLRPIQVFVAKFRSTNVHRIHVKIMQHVLMD